MSSIASTGKRAKYTYTILTRRNTTRTPTPHGYTRTMSAGFSFRLAHNASRIRINSCIVSRSRFYDANSTIHSIHTPWAAAGWARQQVSATGARQAQPPAEGGHQIVSEVLEVELLGMSPSASAPHHRRTRCVSSASLSGASLHPKLSQSTPAPSAEVQHHPLKGSTTRCTPGAPPRSPWPR